MDDDDVVTVAKDEVALDVTDGVEEVVLAVEVTWAADSESDDADVNVKDVVIGAALVELDNRLEADEENNVVATVSKELLSVATEAEALLTSEEELSLTADADAEDDEASVDDVVIVAELESVATSAEDVS